MANSHAYVASIRSISKSETDEYLTIRFATPIPDILCHWPLSSAVEIFFSQCIIDNPSSRPDAQYSIVGCQCSNCQEELTCLRVGIHSQTITHLFPALIENIRRTPSTLPTSLFIDIMVKLMGNEG